MFGLGMGEIMVILIVALLVLGPQKLPDAAKQIGKAIRELRRHTQNLQDTIEQDEHIGGTVRELKSALRGDEIFTPPVVPKIKPPDEKPVAQNETPPADGSAATTTPAVPGAIAAAAETAPAAAETAAAKPTEPAAPATPSPTASPGPTHHG